MTTMYLFFLFFTPSLSFHPSLPPKRHTSLSYYKPNLPLSSRLSEIKSELTNIQARGLDKFLLDEIASAQKRLSNDVNNAEKYADQIVKKGRGEEGQLMRDALKNAGDGELGILNGLKGVRQELEEVKVVKELSGVVEETLKNDLLLENDLQSVTQKVASSLKEAEAAVQSSLVTLSTGEINDDDRDKILKQLGTTLKSLQQSLQTSNTLATSAKRSAGESFSIIQRITTARNELMDAMEDTEDTVDFIAKNSGDTIMQQDGAKGLLEVVNNIGDVAYETIKESEAVEKLANVLTTKVGKEADALISLNTKTTEVVSQNLQDTIRAIKEAKSSEATKLLTDYATTLQHQGDVMKQFVSAIQSDIAKDKSALEMVKNANFKLQALLDAAENQIVITKRAIVTGSTIDPSYVEQNIVDVKSAVLAVIDATKTSVDLAVEKVKSSNARVVDGAKENAEVSVEKVINVPVTTSEPGKEVDTKGDELEQELKSKLTDTKEESLPKTEAKSDTMETKKEVVPKSDDTLADKDMKSSHETSKEDPHEGENPKNEVEVKSIESKVEEKHDIPNGTKSLDEKVPLGEKESHGSLNMSHSTTSSDSPVTVDSLASTSTEHSTVSTASNLAVNAQESNDVLSTASLDVGDMHTSITEVGHEMANTAPHAVEIMHELANAITTTLLL